MSRIRNPAKYLRNKTQQIKKRRTEVLPYSLYVHRELEMFKAKIGQNDRYLTNKLQKIQFKQEITIFVFTEQHNQRLLKSLISVAVKFDSKP